MSKQASIVWRGLVCILFLVFIIYITLAHATEPGKTIQAEFEFRVICGIYQGSLEEYIAWQLLDEQYNAYFLDRETYNDIWLTIVNTQDTEKKLDYFVHVHPQGLRICAPT